MDTECKPKQLEFQSLGRRCVFHANVTADSKRT